MWFLFLQYYKATTKYVIDEWNSIIDPNFIRNLSASFNSTERKMKMQRPDTVWLSNP